MRFLAYEQQKSQTHSYLQLKKFEVYHHIYQARNEYIECPKNAFVQKMASQTKEITNKIRFGENG